MKEDPGKRVVPPTSPTCLSSRPTSFGPGTSVHRDSGGRVGVRHTGGLLTKGRDSEPKD